MSTETLDDRGKALEGKFFRDREQEQIAKLKAKQQREAAISELAEITGFGDEAVLARIVDLGVTPMTLAAFSIVPMLHVAWSDRVLDESERKSILLEATAAGLKSTSPAYGLLESWLTRAPNNELFAAWKAYHEALVPHLSDADRKKMAEELLGRAEKVARSSGGLLGIGSVSSDERQALAELREVLEG